jgi:hypothetical protein
MELAIAIAIFLVVMGFGSYIFLMLFYPEWVGITGSSGKKTLSEHEEGTPAKDEGLFEELTKK